MKYILQVNPVAAPRMTRSDKWAKRPVVCKYFLFRDLLNIEFKKLGLEKLPPIFNIIFYLPIPKSWSIKKKNEMNNKPHQQRPDRDNLLKAFQDALAGEDNYIYDGRVAKFWTKNEEGYIELEF